MKRLFSVVLFLLLTFNCFAGQKEDEKCTPYNSAYGSHSVKLFQTLVSFDDELNTGKALSLVRCELVYYGYNQGKITFKHNEYLSNMDGFYTIPGYTETLEYNIKDNRVIDYKGMKFYILQADDQNLTYKILNSEKDTKISITKLGI